MGFPDDHLTKSFRYLPKYHQKFSLKSMSGNSVQNKKNQMELPDEHLIKSSK